MAVRRYPIRQERIETLNLRLLRGQLQTVAQVSGPSVTMIKRHYGHLRADHAAAALARLTL